MPSLLYFSILSYFLISGLSFIDYLPESLYITQTQLETFLAFFIGVQCVSLGKEYLQIMWGFCAYSLYILLTDPFFDHVTPLQWGLEIIIFSTLVLVSYIFTTKD